MSLWIFALWIFALVTRTVNLDTLNAYTKKTTMRVFPKRVRRTPTEKYIILLESQTDQSRGRTYYRLKRGSNLKQWGLSTPRRPFALLSVVVNQDAVPFYHLAGVCGVETDSYTNLFGPAVWLISQLQYRMHKSLLFT